MKGQPLNVSFQEDASLLLGSSIESICFHQSLNVFIITTSDNHVKVFDPQSGTFLRDAKYTHLENAGEYIICIIG